MDDIKFDTEYAKELRKANGYTIQSLADEVGITRANMSRLMNGKSLPELPTALKIGRALGVYIEELWDFDEE